MTEKQLSLDELQNITGLSDSALLWLLKTGRLRCITNKEGVIFVDISSVELSDLVSALTRIQTESLKKHQDNSQ